MLVPAISRSEEHTKKFAAEIYSEKYFFYCGYSHSHELPKFTAEDNQYRWAIVRESDDEVVGYLAYFIDGVTDTVRNFGLYSFGDNKGKDRKEKDPTYTVGIDVMSHIKDLIIKHHRIEWCVVCGNPVEPMYDKICKRYGGNKVVLHKCTNDANGKWYDSAIYEIVDYPPF